MATYGKDNQKEEVDVRDVMELEKQVLRYEIERCVLGCPYLVSPKMLDWITLLVNSVWREGNVEKQRSWTLAIPIIVMLFYGIDSFWLFTYFAQIGAH